MEKIDEKKWIKKLEKEGFKNITVCPFGSNFNSEEHTHDEHTVHVILSGELTIIDKKRTKTYYPGDKVEFPEGTTHKALGGSTNGSMLVGVKK